MISIWIVLLATIIVSAVMSCLILVGEIVNKFE